jgi:putative ABC transport system permease protein
VVGRLLGGWGWGPARMRVVGIVRDFNDRSLREEVAPLVMVPGLKLANVAVRLKGSNVASAMEHLAKTWREFVPEHPFVYRFASDLVEARYQSEINMRTIAQYASLLAIFVSAMGILGLAAYTASLRTREIGVRKVLGASGFSIFSLLTSEYLKLVAAANLIAWPCAWFFARHWLDGFAYRIDLGVAPFLAGAGLTLGIAALTVCYQSLSAARTQPVEALRHE